MAATVNLLHQSGNRRNPGPSWGCRAIAFWDKLLPHPIGRFILFLGSGISVLCMPRQRKHSKAYLRLVFNRPPTFIDCWWHFFAFSESLVKKLRAARGIYDRFELDPLNSEAFNELIQSKEPALLGAFHVGQSDLMGFFLSDLNYAINMIRLKVDNSDDMNWLGQRFKDTVSFIWVNDERNLLFALKQAIETGKSIAMKCDRIEFSSKVEFFHFLGAARKFPFTIYHLAIIFKVPVLFSIGLSTEAHITRIYNSTLFRPDAGSKADNLKKARAHFQSVLDQLQSLLKAHPFAWFNFEPLNPTR